MLRWLALPGLYLALVATATAAKYATYFQCNLATQSGHLFLLVQVFREPQDEKRPDMGMGTFVIRPGETASVVYKNRLYPGREITSPRTPLGTSPHLS